MIDKEYALVKEKLGEFVSRNGFNVIQEDEYTSVINYFLDFPICKDLIPVLTDNQSNYWCLYIDGPLINKVCYFDHEEPSLEPTFRTIENFLAVLDQHPAFYDYYDFRPYDYDYPPYEKEEADIEVISELKKQLQQEDDKDICRQIAFSIMAMISLDEIESIYPFLYDEDMFIQERAITILGNWKYKPAIELLEELSTTAQHNGKLAAKKALKKINDLN